MQVTGPYRGPVCGLAVTTGGLYYPATPESGEGYSIDFFSFSTGTSGPAVVSDRRIGNLELSVSPNGRFIIYTQVDQSGSDLMLIENFHVR